MHKRFAFFMMKAKEFKGNFELFEPIFLWWLQDTTCYTLNCISFFFSIQSTICCYPTKNVSLQLEIFFSRINDSPVVTVNPHSATLDCSLCHYDIPALYRDESHLISFNLKLSQELCTAQEKIKSILFQDLPIKINENQRNR